MVLYVMHFDVSKSALHHQRRYDIRKSYEVFETHIPYYIQVKVQLRVTCHTQALGYFIAACAIEH